MADLPKTQRAWIVERTGPPAKALSLRSDWPVPSQLEPGEVLVKIQAAALNPVGYKLMKFLPNFAHSGRPLPAEHDLAGEIVDGNGTQFSAGDQVFGYISVELSQSIRQGALTHYVRMPADHLVIRPPHVSPIEASGITLVAETAYEGLVDIAKLEAGQSVLINGGSSAVGAYAIQIAKAKGARVVATASGKNEAFVRKMGADEFIDYTKAPLHKYLEANPPTPKFHVILDSVGLTDISLYAHSPAYLAPNGIFLSTGPLPKNFSPSELWKIATTIFSAYLRPAWLGGIKRRYKVYMLVHKKERLDTIRQMLTDGLLTPPVDSVYDFDDALKAYDRLMSLRAIGKVVIKVDPTAT
ncbi:Zinc-type alcohol dehydrogenase-like protein C16A3.02c [Termitomyces sp. J132]|nr:hypothetical protein H2248_009864 [Termitomyces sp. 'cryptogamus']KNZ75453.1 Zinc-type alcohol dehydrogenase-like protein C16A3.02c [Termitomyces sp. J132]